MWRSLVVLCVVVLIKGDEGDWRVVKTPQGQVRGRKDPLGLYIFRNIPYATVPKGPNKFGAPLPAPTWLQPLETSEKDIVCPQAVSTFMTLDDLIMQEECLIANVYVPITDEKNLPVVVFVHGGAFEMGYGNMFTPKRFVKDHNIITVTFNYRLGVHGFLCLGTDAAPGNAGLKDQVALLQWVNQNIASYGGNPEQVTLAGASAGSMSVDLLMLAKSAKGLFNKVIQESGSSVASVSVQMNPLEGAKLHARELNFTNVDDIYALEEFYQNTPLDQLFAKSFFDRPNVYVPFAPCVERKTSSAFISESPVSIIKKGEYKKVPILLGFSNMEGLLWVTKFDIWKNKMNEKFSYFLPADLWFKNEIQKEEIAEAFKTFYFGDQSVSESTVLSFVDYFSDVHFAYPTLKEVKLLAENGHKQMYLYEYSFVDDQTPLVPHTEVRGANHCAQTIAIFDGVNPLDGTDYESNLSKEYIEMKKAMRQLWSNFVKYGALDFGVFGGNTWFGCECAEAVNHKQSAYRAWVMARAACDPNVGHFKAAYNSKPVPEGSSFPQWPSAGADGSPHMSLGQTIELRGPLIESRVRFWDGIHQKYYQEPIPPPNPPHSEL